MLGERKRFYILDQQISENRAWGERGGGGVLGKVKVRFKVLHFTDTNISITLSASL